MTKLLKLLLISIFLSGCVFVNAEEKTHTDIPITRVENDRKHRKRMPEKRNVIAHYINGCIVLDFMISEDDATVNVRNYNISYEFDESVSTDASVIIPIDEEIGTYQIDIITSKGNHYVGYLTF